MRIKDLERAMGEVTKDSDLSRRSIALKLNSVLTRYGLMLFFRVKMLNWLATRDNEQVKSLEESLKEAEKEVLSVSAERDKALMRGNFLKGSTDVEKKLTVGSTTIVKKVSLELGGNAPCIIFDDADLDVAVRGIAANNKRKEKARKRKELEKGRFSVIDHFSDLRLLPIKPSSIHTNQIRRIMEMKKIACAALVAAAASMSVAMATDAASTPAAASAPSPASDAVAALPAIGSLVGASLVSFFAIYMH
nr:Succinate-semialdehyde dehydrogenase mitochondrial [Ipomoea batatas]